MKKRIFHNWILKLTAVVCAVVVWVVIYNVNDPMSTKRLYNVPVEFENTEVLTENGQVYQVLNGTDKVSNVYIRATESVLRDLNESDIHVIADFNDMKRDGTIELKFESSRHSNSIEITASSYELKLATENKKSKQVFLGVELKGEPADGYIVSEAEAAQTQFKVSGPESIVSRITKATAVVDVTGGTKNIITYADIVLYDSEGRVVSQERLEMGITKVNTTIKILATKTVPVRCVISGEPAAGYVTSGEVEMDLTELQIAGKEAALASVTEIVIEGEEVSIDGANDDISFNIKIDDYLPYGIQRAGKGNGRIEISVKIVPIVEKEFFLKIEQVQIENIPEEYFVAYRPELEQFKIRVRGPEPVIEELNPEDIKGTFDATEWISEQSIVDLKEGIYSVVPKLQDGEDYYIVSHGVIDILLSVLE